MSRSSVREKPEFNVAKATQVAGSFLKLLGGTGYYLLLVKLVYLAERTALLRWGRPLTFDALCSMKNGTVVSGTLNLIKRDRQSAYWEKFISEPVQMKVTLIEDPEDDELSELEDELINEIFEQYGSWDRFELAKFTHTLPEYTETESSIPIGYQEVLKGEGMSGDDISRIMGELQNLAELEAII